VESVLFTIRERGFFDTPRPFIRPIRPRGKKKKNREPFTKEKEEEGKKNEKRREKRRKGKIDDESQRTKARDTTTGKQTPLRLRDENQKG